jgi:hypothetical protein
MLYHVCASIVSNNSQPMIAKVVFVPTGTDGMAVGWMRGTVA